MTAQLRADLEALAEELEASAGQAVPFGLPGPLRTAEHVREILNALDREGEP